MVAGTLLPWGRRPFAFLFNKEKKPLPSQPPRFFLAVEEPTNARISKSKMITCILEPLPWALLTQ
jgi:hypothetical protein